MELKILLWFEELHNPVLDFLMYQITCLGNGGLIWLVIAAAMLFVLIMLSLEELLVMRGIR